MPTATFTNTARRGFRPDKSWTWGECWQGQYKGGDCGGYLLFDFSALGNLANISISTIRMTFSVGAVGGSYTKYLYLHVNGYNGAGAGSYKFTQLYNTTRSLAFSAGSNAAGFAVLRDYILGGGTTIGIGASGSRGKQDGKDFDYDYLSLTGMTLEITYEYLKSEGSVGAAQTGGSATMAITAYNSAYSHRVTWRLGDWSATQDVAAGTASASCQIPHSALPNAVSGTATAELETLNGGTSVGTRTYSVKVTVPDTPTYRPKAGTMSIAAINTGAMAGSSDYFAGASRMAVTLTGAEAGSRSSIASIVYTGWGESITTTATAIETNIIQTAGTVTVYATVTDMRGRSAQTSYTINVVQYNPPYFEDGIVVQRWSTAEQRSDMSGNAIRVNARFGCYTDVFPDNVATATVAYRVRGTDSWLGETSLTSGVDAFLTPAGMDRMTAYELRFRVSDVVMTGENSVFYYYTLPSSQFVLHFGSSGRSVGIGQTAETPVAGEAGRVDINPEWNVYIGGEKLSMRDINETMSLIGSEMPALWYAIKSLQDQIDALRT